MLLSLHRIAAVLSPHTRVIWALITLFLLLTGYSLFVTSAASLLPVGVIGSLWGGLLYAFTRLFERIPPAPTGREGWLTRALMKLKRALYTLLAILVLAATVAVLMLSLRLALV